VDHLRGGNKALMRRSKELKDSGAHAEADGDGREVPRESWKLVSKEKRSSSSPALHYSSADSESIHAWTLSRATFKSMVVCRFPFLRLFDLIHKAVTPFIIELNCVSSG
jgi:hypothetical protein